MDSKHNFAAAGAAWVRLINLSSDHRDIQADALLTSSTQQGVKLRPWLHKGVFGVAKSRVWDYRGAHGDVAASPSDGQPSKRCSLCFGSEQWMGHLTPSHVPSSRALPPGRGRGCPQCFGAIHDAVFSIARRNRGVGRRISNGVHHPAGKEERKTVIIGRLQEGSDNQ